MSGSTTAFQAAEQGRTEAVGDLLAIVYEELLKLAAARMARESEGHTFQPTALVH
jgi:ECF sigma factor